MARYYIVVFVVNFIFATVFYFLKIKKSGFSSRAFLFAAGLSLFIGIVFPPLVGYFNIYAVVGINLLIICLGAYFIVRAESGERTPDIFQTLEERLEGQHAAAPVAGTGEGEKPVPVTAATTEGQPDEEKIAEEEQIPGKDEAVQPSALTAETLDEMPDFLETLPVSRAGANTVAEESAPAVEEKGTAEAEKTGADNDVGPEEADEIEDGLAEAAASMENELPAGVDYGVEISDKPAAGNRDNIDDSEEVQGERLMGIKQLRVEDDIDLRDSYVERGFDAKAEGKLDLAVKYFSSALELNPPVDLQIMLVLDIFAMLREMGQYQKAKEVLEQFGQELSAELPPTLAEEMGVSLKYTEFLQEMLIKANTPNLPFSKVPALIRVSVEEKVNQWKNEAL